MVWLSRTGNLPSGDSGFVGRRRETSDIRRLLRGPEPLTLTGPGGVGKTSLARHVATEARRDFPDGVWMVDLATLTADALLAKVVINALRATDNLSGRHAVSALGDHLRHRRLLLILDGCDQVADSCAGLVPALMHAAPGLRVLATSRESLKLAGERVLTVPPLSVPRGDPLPAVGGARRYDAVRLFIERAGAVLPGFRVESDNWITVARLCQRLAGMPLAIELAAVRLRSLSLEQVLDRLDRFHSFTAVTHSWGSSQPGLEGTIRWSHSLCSEQERRLWSRLSVFAGGFDLQAAQTVCGDGQPGPDRKPVADGGDIPHQDVFDLIAALVDTAALTRDGEGVRARYRVHQSIHGFGAALPSSLAAGKAMRDRHRDYYLRLAERFEAEWFSPRQGEWLDRLHRERANLEAALEHSLTEPGEAPVALAIAGSLHRFWAAGLVDEGRRWLDRALALDERPTRERAKALVVAADLALAHGEVDAALVPLAECHQLARLMGDEAALADAIQCSGAAAFAEDDVPGALMLFDEALERYRERGDLYRVSLTLCQMMTPSALLDDPRTAALGEECLFLCDAYGAQYSRSRALWEMGLGKWRRGDRRQALLLVRKSLRLKRLIHDPWGTGLCLEVLAWIAASSPEDRRAARLLGACETAWQLSGSRLRVSGPDSVFHEECRQRIRATLGAENFQILFAQGARMPLERAIGYALGELSAEQAPQRPADESVLTRRERQVAGLVARHLNTKEIAAVLGVSERTVDAHIERIGTKLWLASSDDIADWVGRNKAPPSTG